VELTHRAIKGIQLLAPRVFGNERGFFLASWNRRTSATLGLDVDFVQDNHSRSRGVLRGLHPQNPEAEGELVRAVAGAVFDVVVDPPNQHWLPRNDPAIGIGSPLEDFETALSGKDRTATTPAEAMWFA